MTKKYVSPGQEDAKGNIPAMTPQQRRRWERYRRVLEELPPGAELCSGAIQSVADSGEEGERGRTL